MVLYVRIGDKKKQEALSLPTLPQGLVKRQSLLPLQQVARYIYAALVITLTNPDYKCELLSQNEFI